MCSNWKKDDSVPPHLKTITMTSLQQDPVACIPLDDAPSKTSSEFVGIVGDDLAHLLAVATKQIRQFEARAQSEAETSAVQTLRGLDEQLFVSQQQVAALELEYAKLDTMLSEINECIGVFEMKEEAEAELLSVNETLVSFETEPMGTAEAEREALRARLSRLETAYSICMSRSASDPQAQAHLGK